MAVSYGTYTITEVQEGSQIWTSSAAPTTPDYTFNVSHLTGDSDIPIREGDIILNSYYRYTVLSISSDGTTVLTGNRTSIRGATGAASVTYTLIVSNLAIVKDKNENLSPSTITVTAKSQTGSNAMANYTGRIKIETTTNNSTWTSRINEDAATKTYTIPSDTVAIRCSLYLKGGTTTLLDQQTVPVVSDGIDGINGTNGKDGADGKDAYTVILTNENHTFAGNTTSAIASEIECNVIAYKGATQIAATIGTITGQPTGMTTSLSNNGTVNAAFKITVTTSMVTKNGVLNVPITVDNKVFTKKFTYGLALDGENGKDGGRWYSGTSITGTSTTATVFSGSGISSAVIGDMYLNTSTYNTYRCTLGGNASTAKWVYVNNIKGTHGDTGKGVSSIVNQYYLSTSNTTQTGGSWSTTVPPYVEDCYYWTKSHIVWTDNTETDTTAVLDNGLTDANANAIDARKVATNYLSADSTGIMVADMQDGEQIPSIATGRNVFIDSDSVDIRDGQNILASFTGDETKFYDSTLETEIASFGINGARIGNKDGQHFMVDSESINAVNENGSTIFSVSSTNATAPAIVTVIDEVRSRKSGGVIYTLPDLNYNTSNTFYIKKLRVTFYTPAAFSARFWSAPEYSTPSDAKVFYVSPDSTQTTTKVIMQFPEVSFTYGTPITIQYKIKAYPRFKHISGDATYDGLILIYYNGDKRLEFSKYQGTWTVSGRTYTSQYEDEYRAYDIMSDAGTMKAPSMTFGTRATDGTITAFSTTIGEGLYANAPNQLTIGKYNLNNDEFNPLAFAIGNGTDNVDRSNAFTVDWNGDTELSGNLTVAENINVTGRLTSDGNSGLFVLDTASTVISSIGTYASCRGNINITKSGYTPIAIAGFGITGDNGWCVFPRCYITKDESDSTIDYLNFYIWNQNSKVAFNNVTIEVKILYIASSAF